MSVGKRRLRLYWKVGETVRVRMLTDGYIDIEDGKPVRHLGLKLYIHYARGRSWPMPCGKGDCPDCMRGFEPSLRYVIPFDVMLDGEWVTIRESRVLQTLEAELSKFVAESIAGGENPVGKVLDITRLTTARWQVQEVP